MLSVWTYICLDTHNFFLCNLGYNKIVFYKAIQSNLQIDF